MRFYDERLQAMSEDEDGAWVLLPNDVKAIRWVLSEIERLTSEVARLEKAESDRTERFRQANALMAEQDENDRLEYKANKRS